MDNLVMLFGGFICGLIWYPPLKAFVLYLFRKKDKEPKPKPARKPEVPEFEFDADDLLKLFDPDEFTTNSITLTVNNAAICRLRLGEDVNTPQVAMAIRLITSKTGA